MRFLTATATVATFTFANGGLQGSSTLSPPVADILGTTRPSTGSRYDIGAEQFVPGSGPTPAGGGRGVFHR